MAKVYACAQCFKPFPSSRQLNQHSQTHESPKFKCEQCLKPFKFLAGLNEHRSVHLSVNLNYKCPVCKTKKRLKGNLKKHLKTHLNDEEHQNIDLGKKKIEEMMAKACKAGQQPIKTDSETKESGRKIANNLQKRDQSSRKKEESDEELDMTPEDVEEESDKEDTDNEPEPVDENLPTTSERARQIRDRLLEDEDLVSDEDLTRLLSVNQRSMELLRMPENKNERAAAKKKRPRRESESDTDMDSEFEFSVRRTEAMRRTIEVHRRFADVRRRNKQNKPSASDILGESDSEDEYSISTKNSTTGLVCCDLPLNLPYNVSNRICNGPHLELKAKKETKSKKTKKNKKSQQEVEAPKTECRIAPEAKYMEHGTVSQNYCIPCFKNVTADRKSYSEKTNIHEESEDILECQKCKEKRHRCCTTYRGAGTKFICENCWTPKDSKFLRDPKLFKILNKNSRYRTEFSRKIENRLNRLQGKRGTRISARVLLSAKRTVKTEELAPELYHKEFEDRYSKTITYRTRTILLFQRQKSFSGSEHDILFFILFADEYKNMEGKKSFFNIDYLDTAELLIDPGKGFLWANPPLPRDDFIFNIHPGWQTYRDKVKLIEWYRKMMDSGKKSSDTMKREIIIEKYLDFGEMQQKGKMDAIEKLPLFRECLWQKLMKQHEDDLQDLDGSADYKAEYGDGMQWHWKQHQKDNFFIFLQKPNTVVEKLEEMTHADSELLNREAFLDFCIENNYEWVDQRRAMFSSSWVIELLESVM